MTGYDDPSPLYHRHRFPWRAVDQDGLVLEVLEQSRRNAKAAKRLMPASPWVAILATTDHSSPHLPGQRAVARAAREERLSSPQS